MLILFLKKFLYKPFKMKYHKPMKEIEMTREVKKEVQSKPMNNTALGVYKGSDGCWMVAELVYNPETKEAKMVNSVRAGMDYLNVEERFDVMVEQQEWSEE
jgi:hypothetical protein